MLGTATSQFIRYTYDLKPEDSFTHDGLHAAAVYDSKGFLT